MPLANSCVLRRHCRRLAFFLPCFACTGPGDMHSHPGAQDPVRSSERRPAAHSPPILAPPRSPFRRLLPWCSHPPPASPGSSASPRPGLPTTSASLPSLLSEPTWRPSGPRAPRSDAGRAAGCGRRTSPAPSTGGPPPRPHAELLSLQTSGPMGLNSQLLARSPGDLPAPGNWWPNTKHRGCSETRGLSSLRQ